MRASQILFGLAAMAAGMTLPAMAAGPLTVVELFTSQGCSSCPPANANLIELSKRPGVLPLSFAVTYWDRLGWKDTFGQEAFTTRQRVYEPALGERGPFTPQMVINGRTSLVGNRLGEVDAAIAKASMPAAPDLALSGGRVAIGAGPAPSDGADVWIVRYDPGLVDVPVRSGENSGETLPHTHVVHALEVLGQWTGKAADFAVPAAGDGLKTAILVQGKHGGPILAAVTD